MWPARWPNNGPWPGLSWKEMWPARWPNMAWFRLLILVLQCIWFLLLSNFCYTLFCTYFFHVVVAGFIPSYPDIFRLFDTDYLSEVKKVHEV